VKLASKRYRVYRNVQKGALLNDYIFLLMSFLLFTRSRSFGSHCYVKSQLDIVIARGNGPPM